MNCTLNIERTFSDGTKHHFQLEHELLHILIESAAKAMAQGLDTLLYLGGSQIISINDGEKVIRRMTIENIINN